jgi:hypothetical protein
MSKDNLKSLSELISLSNSPLSRLAQEARSRLELADHIRAGLADDLSAEMTSCILDTDGTLVVRASNPAWAARLRFESERLLVLCRERRPETRSVKVKVSRHGA